ncbi:MAG: family 10 glycosylhydrolase [Candidatus Brocadiia bacterium]|nr:family 10 glycosylhydrolase [Candidatus Brocadiia bacterium]
MSEFALAVWSHRITDFGEQEDIARHADRLAAGGFDLVIPCVKNPPGGVDFFTNLAHVNEEYPDWDPLRVLIEECRQRGLKVHPWFCVFLEGDRSRLLRERPEYTARNTESIRWGCTCRPEVQDNVFALYEDLAQRYDPDGLHLDYIRTGGPCRCEFCKAQMREQGVDIEAVEPAEPAHEQWTQWRVSRLAAFVRRMHELTAGRGIELSAAVFADYPDCIVQQAQDWVLWAEEGIVDYLFPMTYTPSARVAWARTVSHVALVRDRVPLWEGLSKDCEQGRLTPALLADQARTVLEAGARGVVLFQYPSVSDEDIAALGALRSS